eukprot:5487229-Prymnesium_polylepis.1
MHAEATKSICRARTGSRKPRATPDEPNPGHPYEADTGEGVRVGIAWGAGRPHINMPARRPRPTPRHPPRVVQLTRCNAETRHLLAQSTITLLRWPAASCCSFCSSAITLSRAPLSPAQSNSTMSRAMGSARSAYSLAVDHCFAPLNCLAPSSNLRFAALTADAHRLYPKWSVHEPQRELGSARLIAFT